MDVETPVRPEVASLKTLYGRVLKRWFDLGSTLLTLPFWLPLIGLLGLIIKWRTGGPVFYRRRVVGREGEFDAFKLRTMRVDADLVLQNNPQLAAEFLKNFKLKNDPRLTRTGRLLRRWSLDELPQLFNVLRGQMSLVGPRMITRPELEKYGSFQSLLLTVKPGLTGYWQVSGRQDVSYEERVKMDVFYIQNWSLWFDFKILSRTLWKVLKREGAY
jgi:lipopolysaccharide/colanic/teichoic acid biosynthesis glycosyltransferase